MGSTMKNLIKTLLLLGAVLPSHSCNSNRYERSAHAIVVADEG